MTASPPPATRGPVGTGVILCGVSATAYGLLGLFGRQSFATGSSLQTVIGWRFVIATVVLALVVVALRRPLGRGRAVWQPLIMGAVIYAIQNSLYFAALQQIPAGLTALLLYLMPVMVVLVEVARRTLRPSRRLVVATVLAVGGIGLTVIGPTGGLSVIGVLCGLGSAVCYTVYYFAMDSLPDGTDWVTSSMLVCAGVAVSQVVVGTVLGTFDPTPEPGLWAWVIPMALLSTVVALSLLMVGARLAGPSIAAVVSCLEPVVSVIIGATALDDPFGPPQALGAASVVAAVVILSWRRRRTPVPVEP